MNWFSGVLYQTDSGGWNVIRTWAGVSFSDVERIVKDLALPDAHFRYEPSAICLGLRNFME